VESLSISSLFFSLPRRKTILIQLNTLPVTSSIAHLLPHFMPRYVRFRAAMPFIDAHYCLKQT
ncbi:hypothetical protein, partial [Aeromonas aquatica]|uniref:hypothetical protein n=1 Tax=Aeromonas aquatica TaxID=558964 RepID=UPI001EE76E24